MKTSDVSRMSIRQKVGSVLNRNPTSLEAEREQAIQNFFITLQKACYKNDEAPKEKHVRATICQTHEAHSSTLFWKLAAKLPLAVNAISCWKFCYIVHKLLRDGHHSMSKDSRAYIPKLEELGRYWGHIQGYGPLIDHYMKLLVTSVNFRVKYEFIPGTLKQDKIDLDRKIGNQVDAKFEFVLDILDLLEQLLLFQKQIFRTFDRSGSSATNSGQNRLTPCVPVILDTQELYSMCVKFLSILHNELPSEPLSGFRERFLKLYSELKQFYASCLNIHFLRQIVSIPKMPENPPDFHSSIPNFNQHHETLQQANVVPVRPPSPVETESETLIDISHGLDDLNVQEFQEHSQIDRMQSQIESLRSELAESKREQVVEVTKLLEHIAKLEAEKEQIQFQAADLAANAASATQLNKVESDLVASQTKYSNLENAYKMLKDKHLKLIDNHAALLRSSSSEKDSIKNELFQKYSKEEAAFKAFKSSLLDLVIEENSKNISKKKSEIGSESLEDRIESLKNQVQILETKVDDEARFSIGLAMTGAQLVDISAESAQKDGNLITASINLLDESENCYNQLLVQRDAFKSEQVTSALTVLQTEIKKLKDDVIEVPSAIIDTELSCASQMVEQAAARIREILANARNQLTGNELKVHEDILANCNQLMDFILKLIQQSDILQKEIVEHGRGAGSAADFYNRNSRWTEGLLSAAKAVGLRAQTLTDYADQCVKGTGNFDSLIVASREITASTAQLVAASRVKASRSEKLAMLESLSKMVNKSAGEVVGASQAGKENIEALETIDFTKMSYTQAKKIEMDTQVKIMGLEAQLDKERKKVRDIRKSAYDNPNQENPVAQSINTNPFRAKEDNLADIANVLRNAPPVPTSNPPTKISPTPLIGPAGTAPTPAPRKSLSPSETTPDLLNFE